MLSEGPRNGLACTNGAGEGAECKQECFLHLLWECFNEAVQFVQECGRLIKIEILYGVRGYRSDIYLPGETTTLTYVLDIDRLSNLL